MTNLPRVPNLDIESLKTFFTVAKCRSFSEAAEELHKTPAAISYRIKTLEDQLGLALFARTTRTVDLLPAGEHLLEYVSKIYSLLQDLPRELQQLSQGVEQEFTIVVNNLLISNEGISDLMAYLTQKFPCTHFRITRAVYNGVWDQLIGNRADFAIGVPSWHSISNDFDTRPIGEIRWVFVCAPHHPLAHNVGGEPISDDELRGYLAVNVEDTSLELRKRTAWLLTGQKECLVPTLHAKLNCHLRGVGVGFLPERLARPYINRGELVVKEVVNARTPSPMAIAWRKDSLGAVHSALVQLLTKSEKPEPLARFFDMLNQSYHQQ